VIGARRKKTALGRWPTWPTFANFEMPGVGPCLTTTRAFSRCATRDSDRSVFIRSDSAHARSSNTLGVSRREPLAAQSAPPWRTADARAAAAGPILQRKLERRKVARRLLASIICRRDNTYPCVAASLSPGSAVVSRRERRRHVLGEPSRATRGRLYSPGSRTEKLCSDICASVHG
jgi:hypothetical protein